MGIDTDAAQFKEGLSDARKQANDDASYDVKDRVRDVFSQWDNDGDGVISKVELSQVLEMLGVGSETIKTIQTAMDLDKNGVVDYDEFCDWVFGRAKEDLPVDAFERKVSARQLR